MSKNIVHDSPKKGKLEVQTCKIPAPEWLRTTPPECTYDLVMFGDSGGSVQSIPLTRHEFCELKLTLAHLRGCDTLHMTAADVSEGE